MQQRPDVVLLLLDTQRVDRLSCYGYARETSPELDAFAADSTRFTQAVAPAQWTVPTHASIFTGLYPSQHTVHQMHSVLPEHLPTVAERLSQAGYYTAGFSQNPLIGQVKNNLSRGFVRFENHHLLSNALLTTRLNRPETQPVGTAAVRQALRLILAEALGYSRETPLHYLAYFLSPMWKTFQQLRGTSKSASTRRLLTAAAELLIRRQELQTNQPVFVFVNLMGTHIPYDPPEWAVHRYLAPIGDPRPVSVLLRWANQMQVDVANWLVAPMTEAEQDVLGAIYDAEVAAQDAQVGHFLARLQQAGRLGDTFIVVVADHGDHLGDKERINHAFGVYQALVHVPLIISDPTGALPRRHTVHDFVSTRRLFHTLLVAAEAATRDEERLALSQRAHEATEGRQLEADEVLAEGHPLDYALQRLHAKKASLARVLGLDRPVRALYGANHKLIAGALSQALYAVRRDPMEQHDLQSQLTDETLRLQQRLQALVKALHPVAQAQHHEEDDPRILKHLRDLGYME